MRSWLSKNHAKQSELWIGFYKKAARKKGVNYSEAVDQALCFGWIDGVRKSIDDVSYTNRFSPRKPRSSWSTVNIKRVRELSKLGLMEPSGLEAFENRDRKRSGAYSYESRPQKFDAAYARRFRRNKKAWEFFQAQPPGYQRTAIWWVISAKKEETRLRRLDVLIEDSENGLRLAM